MSDKDDHIPDPEEIGKKLSDFMKENFGNMVSFTTMPGGMVPQSDEDPDEPPTHDL